jgi:hypothetical protein
MRVNGSHSVNAREYHEGMRIGVLLSDGKVKEIPRDRIQHILISGSRLPDELPLTGYKVVVL